jgi:hypothetical protein
VLEVAPKVVLGDPIKIAVRGRPGNPYLVAADVGRKQAVFSGAVIHLDMGPFLTIFGSGTLAPNGAAVFEVPTPRAPVLENLTLFFQALADDAAVPRRVAASDGKSCTLLRDDGQPLITLLTVNKIPRDLNGAEIGEGGLFVPTSGFTIDLSFATRGQRADRSALAVRDLRQGARPRHDPAEHEPRAVLSRSATATARRPRPSRRRGRSPRGRP